MMLKRLITAGLVWLTLAGSGLAQLSCNTGLTQTQLLQEFSDLAPPASIAPANVRDIICNVILNTNIAGLVGAQLNSRMTIASAGTTGTFTADQVVTAVSLTGAQYKLNSYSQTINTATVGAGGMDTGVAPTSGFVAIYAIYNPSSSTTSILGTNATSTPQPTIYSNGHMPSGYTASALISVWPTNSSFQLIAANQTNRSVDFVVSTALSAGTVSSTYTALSLASAQVPPNAIRVRGNVLVQQSSVSGEGGITTNIAGSNVSTGIGVNSFLIQADGIQQFQNYYNVPIPTSQTLYYNSTATGGSTPITITISTTGYDF